MDKRSIDVLVATAVESGDTITVILISHGDLADNLGYVNSLETSEV